MAPSNADIVRDMFRAWNERRLADASAAIADHVIWDARLHPAPELQRVYVGRPALAGFWTDWLAAWQHIHADIVWVRSAGDRVVAWVHQHHVGKGSHVELDVDYCWDTVLHDGLVDRVVFHLDEVRARASIPAGGPSAVTALFDAWNRGDLPALQAATTEDVVFRTSGVYPGLEAIYHAHNGLVDFWNDFREPWSEHWIDIESTTPIGVDRVLALLRFRGATRQGVVVTRESAQLMTLRDGLVTSFHAFGSHAEALRGAADVLAGGSLVSEGLRDPQPR